MSHNEHSHGKEHHHEHPVKRKIHHDWRVWTVILMLLAILIYVATMDEAEQPGGNVQQPVPAAP